LLEPDRLAAGSELDDAVALRVAHAVGEHGRTLLPRGRSLQDLGQVVPVEDVVAEGERRAVPAHELASDQERLGEPLRLRLRRPREADPELRAVAEQALEAVLLVRRRDHQDLADARQHQRRERVVDHRLVVDGDELLRYAERDRVQARARAAGEDDALHDGAAYTGPRLRAARWLMLRA